MSIATQIDDLAERAKRLPEDRQQAIVEALREMIDEPYQLSDAELAILEPALTDAVAGRNLVSLEETTKRTREIVSKWRN